MYKYYKNSRQSLKNVLYRKKKNYGSFKNLKCTLSMKQIARNSLKTENLEISAAEIKLITKRNEVT